MRIGATRPPLRFNKVSLSLTSGIDELFGQVFEGSGDSTDYKKLRIPGDVTSM